MSHRFPRVRAASAAIIDLEVAGRETPARFAQGIELAFRRFHELMSTVLGRVGFDAVLTRALHLTRPTCEWIDDELIQFGPSLTMQGLAEIVEREGAPNVRGGAAELLAHVVDLLCTFIGEDLTFRLIRRIWKDLPGGAGSLEDS